MAVGARITSENLSGKTATVTFTPYTGETSGTTVNLGSKTIPFNNINTHPYGVYSLYLAEYDYTYTLTIPEPITEAQLFVYVDRMTTSDNYGAAMLNFTDFTAEVIDLGVDSTYWTNNNIRPLQNSGFMYEFNGDNNYQEKLIIFTDVSGLEIGRYTGITDNYSADSLDGRVLYFEDEQNGVLTYSNGRTVHTYTWDPQTHYIDIEWDWYAVTSDNTFIIKKREQGQWTYNGNGQSYLVNTEDGTTTLFKTWADADGTFVRHKMQPNTNFIVVETETGTVSGYSYTNFEICDTSGGVLESVSLTGATYTDRNDDFLGSTKYCVIYFNYNDNAVDYKIIHYNGETVTLTQTSHVRGVEYAEHNMQGDNDFWSDNSNIDGGVVITLNNQINYNQVGVEVTYCDIIYMLDNQTSFNTYEVANDTTVNVSTYGQLTNIYRTPIVTGNFFEILTISTTGGTITTTEIPFSGVTSINRYHLADRTVFAVLTNDAFDITALLINQNGSIADTFSKTMTNTYNYNIDTQGGIFYIRLYISGGDEAYYVYSGSTGFTSTSVYNSVSTPDTTYTETSLEPEIMFLYSEGGGNARILSSTGISAEFTTPTMYNYSTRVGADKVMIVYADPNDNDYVKIRLYNSSGSLLNSTSTTYTTWDDTYAIGNRFVVKFNGQGENYYYLISEETITSVILSNYDIEWAPNDYQWWDDY